MEFGGDDPGKKIQDGFSLTQTDSEGRELFGGRVNAQGRRRKDSGGGTVTTTDSGRRRKGDSGGGTITTTDGGRRRKGDSGGGNSGLPAKQHPPTTLFHCTPGGIVAATKWCAQQTKAAFGKGMQVQSKSPKSSNAAHGKKCPAGQEFWQCEIFDKWNGFCRNTFPAKSEYYFYASQGCVNKISR